MKWKDIIARWNEGTKTRANDAITQALGADTALAQGEEDALRSRNKTARSAGNVVGYYETVRLQHEKLTAERDKLKADLGKAVKRYNEAKTAGDAERMKLFKEGGAKLSSRLVAKESELDTCTQALVEAKAAVDDAQTMATAADTRYEEKQQQAQRLRGMQARAALAKSVTEELNGMYGDPDRHTATMDDAARMIERDYADAVGQRQIAQNSGAAQQVRFEAELTKSAGDDLFEQALNAEDLNGDGIPDHLQDPAYVAATTPKGAGAAGSAVADDATSAAPFA